MSQEGYLVALERQHEQLKKELSQERNRSPWNDLELAAIKRKKLQIKDEIAAARRAQATFLSLCDEFHPIRAKSLAV